MKKKIISCIVAVVLLSAIAYRIAYVNVTAYTIPKETYTTREWVDFDGSFLDTIDENTAGYSIMVNNVTVGTYQEYIDKYNNGDVNIVMEPARPQKIIDLDVTIKNTGSEDGYILTGMMCLRAINSPIRRFTELWRLMEPDIASKYLTKRGSIFLPKNTEITMHIPYGYNSEVDKFNCKLNFTTELVLTNFPVSKVINLRIDV